MNPEASLNVVEGTTNLLNDNGVGTVLMAIFIVFYMISQWRDHKRQDEDRKAREETHQELLKTILETQRQFLESKESQSHTEKNLMDIYMKINNKLREDCKEALDYLDADRTAIYAFHNGSQSIHGLPFFKFSCICEYIQKGSGSKSKMKSHSSIPINLLDDVIDTLWRDGHYHYFASDKDETSNNFINKLLLQDDNKTCILYTIYDMESRPIGFILSEFGEESFTPEELKDKKKYLKYLGEKVSPVLEFSSYHKSMQKEGMF